MIQQPFLGQTAGGQVPLPTASQGNRSPPSILNTRPIPIAPTTAAAEQPRFNSSYFARGNVPPVSVSSAFVGDSKSSLSGSQPGSQVSAGPPDMDFYRNCPLEELRRDLGRLNEILGDRTGGRSEWTTRRHGQMTGLINSAGAHLRAMKNEVYCGAPAGLGRSPNGCLGRRPQLHSCSEAAQGSGAEPQRGLGWI